MIFALYIFGTLTADLYGLGNGCDINASRPTYHIVKDSNLIKRAIPFSLPVELHVYVDMQHALV
jgi:hypothetical protein